MSNLRLDTAASSAHGTTGLINLTSTSRTLAQSSPPGNNRPLTSNTVATKAPPVPASSKASEGVTAAQQQLWASLKLDPLLIQHATGLHRVLHDVQTLSQQFQSFANHLLAMSKTGASLTNHLQKLYRQDSVPDSVRSLAAAHHSMQQSSVDWFSSKFKNEIMNLFADWEEDASDVLSQLGLVQKTRHELDGLQDEVERIFTKKLESPVWDEKAEAALQRRLENSKEKLAAACMLYDGQRRGVEKSMRFLLDQRALLFHSVTTCFVEYEYRFFRDFTAHAAAFCIAHPYSANPPVLAFEEEPFGTQGDGVTDAEHSASALLLTLPAFQWPDPAHQDESLEGPSVRAIRRSMLNKVRRDSSSKERRNSVDTSDAAAAAAKASAQPDPSEVLSPSRRDEKAAWEDSAEEWKNRSDLERASKDATAREEIAKLPSPVAAHGSLAPPPSTVDAEIVEDLTLVDLSSPPLNKKSSPNSVTRTSKSPSSSEKKVARGGASSTREVEEATDSDATEDDDERKEQDETFVSPEPLPSPDGRIVYSDPALSTSAADRPFVTGLEAAANEAELLQVTDATARAAAALNLPAKLASSPLPSTRLHPALWSRVPLPQVRGSVWSKILVEHTEFDEQTDEMREKYALGTEIKGVLEKAFATDADLATFEQRRQKEYEARQAQVMEAAASRRIQASPSNGGVLAVGSSSPSQATVGAAGVHDRFAHMRTLDSQALVPLSQPVWLQNAQATIFPAAPYPGFGAKQWYLAQMLLTKILYPLTPEAIVEAVYKLDDKLLTPNRVQSLMRIMPTPEQSQLLLRCERPQPLTPIEQLYTLLSLTTSPTLDTRLHALQFQVEFGPLCQHLENTLETLQKCAAEIKRSQNLRIIFALLLHLGNHMNASHLIPPSYGFDIEFLTQVRRITMQQSNSTLLDFLVYFIATNHAHLNFTSFSQGSFKHLQAALKVDEWLLAMELRYLGEEHAKVRKMNEQDEYEKQNRSVTSPSADDHDDGAPRFPFPVSSFPPRVPRFLQYSTQRLTILRHRYQAAKTDIIDLCKFLCVQPEEVVDPSADSLPSSGGGPDSPTRTDAFGFSHLLPLGEVASSVTTAATLMSSSSRADFGENVPTHTRFNWLGALTTLHTFIGEFALAHSDFTVSQRGRKAAPAANRS